MRLDAGPTLRAISEALDARDFARAIALSDDALAAGVEHPLILNLLALKHDQAGRHAQALRLLQRAVELAPDDVGSLNALGLCFLALERDSEALSAFLKVVAQLPEAAFAHANLASVQRRLGELDKADAAYAMALKLDPVHPLALAGRGSIASMRGDHGSARDFALRALQVAPTLAEAHGCVAAADISQGRTDQALDRASTLLKDPQLPALDRVDALGIQGDAWDRQGDYRQAFAAYAKRNQLLQDHYRSGFEEGPRAMAYVQALTATIERLPHNGVALGVEHHGPQPVFLVGFPRSGTTLLEVVLDGHPKVATLDEQEFLLPGVHLYLSDPADLGALWRASDSDLEPLRTAYWAAVRGRGIDPAERLVVDKYPLNLLKLPLIARLFPGARVVYAQRDPRDVVLSVFRRRFRMSAPMYELLTLDGAARFYAAVEHLMQQLLPRLGLAVHTVRHESVVADLPGEVGRLCDFLGIEWTDSMADFAGRSRTRRSATPSTAQLGVGLDSRGIGHWRYYSFALEAVVPHLQSALSRYGEL